MKNQLKTLRRILLVSAVLSAALAASGSAPSAPDSTIAAGDIAVIVNPSTPVNNISLGELRAILNADRRNWNLKTPATVLMRMPGTRERRVILEKVLRVSETDYKRFWVGKVFRGEATNEPASAPSLGLALDYVSNVKGAISFVNADQVQARVKTLRVNGKLPGEAGYPLR